MNVLEVFDYEATHGMQMIIDIHLAVEAARRKAAAGGSCETESVEYIAKRTRKTVNWIHRFLRAYENLKHREIQQAAKEVPYP